MKPSFDATATTLIVLAFLLSFGNTSAITESFLLEWVRMSESRRPGIPSCLCRCYDPQLDLLLIPRGDVTENSLCSFSGAKQENYREAFVRPYRSEKLMEPDCIPKFTRSPIAEAKGTAVIWDGFTTCRHQSENIAAVLLNEGYNVIHPNHLGVSSSAAYLTIFGEEEYWALPTESSQYSEQIARVTTILKEIKRENHQVRLTRTLCFGRNFTLHFAFVVRSL